VNKFNVLCHASLIAFTLLSCPRVTPAATPRDAGDQALRKAQYLLKKLTDEKAELERENTRLAGELKKAQEELAGTRKTLSASEAHNTQQRQHNEALVERVRADSERLGTLQATYRKEIGDARADIRLLINAVREREAWISDCQSKNEAMFKTNSELVKVYEHKGIWDALTQHEPVSGIASVKMENLVQDYRFRLEDLRTVKFAPSVPVPESAVAHEGSSSAVP
jgi:Skp family chaperone for outer membrane proteins